MHDEPSIGRRDFVAGALSTLAAARLVSARSAAGPTRDYLVHVGTYTENGRTDGIFALGVSAAGTGAHQDAAFDAGANPSYLVRHPERRIVYAVNETTEWGGAKTGSVTAIALDADGRRATKLGETRASGGGAPCYLSLDRGARHLLVANYVGGSVAVLPIARDGSVGEATSVVRHEGHGPNAGRQEAPHAHCIIPDPSGRFALAADLGIDRIMIYRFDARRGTLAPAATPFAALPAGAGPRHLAFHPNGRLLYVVCELDRTLATSRWDAGAGTLTPVGTIVQLLAEPAAGETLAADLHVDGGGRFLWASVRGPNLLVTCEIDPRTGQPAVIQRIATGGDWPRNFAVDPAGRFLLVANQRSNTITSFAIARDSGRLTRSPLTLDVPSPVCIRFG